MKKTILILLIAAVYIGTLVIALVVGVVDQGKIEELHDHSEYYSTFNDRHQCQMPGCGDTSDTYLACSVSAQYRRFANLRIPNKANFAVKTGEQQITDTVKVRDSEKYISIRPQSDGSFRASVEEEEYTYDMDGKTYTHYYTGMYGYYCDQHKDEAKEIMLDELETGIKSTLVYVWGKTLFPGNLVILTWVLAFLFAAFSECGGDLPNSFVGFVLLTVVFCVLTTLCCMIKDDVIRGTLFFTLALGSAGAGALPSILLGFKLASIRTRRRLNKKC